MSPSPTATHSDPSIQTVYVTTPAILGHHDGNAQLSSGRIAGITISAVIALHVLAGMAILLWHRRRRRHKSELAEKNRTEDGSGSPEKIEAEESAQPSRMPSGIELGGSAVFEIMGGALHELPGRNMESRRSRDGGVVLQTFRNGDARPRTAGTLTRVRDVSRVRPGTAMTLGAERRSMGGRPLGFAPTEEVPRSFGGRARSASASAHIRDVQRPPSAGIRSGVERERREEVRRTKSVDEWMLFERRKSAPWVTQWDM